MENYSSLLDTIKNAIRENNNGEITGDILQAVLASMVNTIGEYPTFAGIATPSTNPSGVEQNVFYLASQAGFYNSFRDGLELKKGLYVLYQSTDTWTAASLISEGAITTSAIAANAVNSSRLADELVYSTEVYNVSISYYEFHANIVCETWGNNLGKHYGTVIVDASKVEDTMEELYIELPRADNIMELTLFLEVRNLPSNASIAVFFDSSAYTIENSKIDGDLTKYGVLHFKRIWMDEIPTFIVTGQLGDAATALVSTGRIADAAITTPKLKRN